MWAFFSHFPTTGSEVTAETRHRFSPSPTVPAQPWANVSQRRQPFVLSFNPSSVSLASLDLWYYIFIVNTVSSLLCVAVYLSVSVSLIFLNFSCLHFQLLLSLPRLFLFFSIITG